eukprot:14377979-Alexandrium_andersonii.AAC.1
MARPGGRAELTRELASFRSPDTGFWDEITVMAQEAARCPKRKSVVARLSDVHVAGLGIDKLRAAARGKKGRC